MYVPVQSMYMKCITNLILDLALHLEVRYIIYQIWSPYRSYIFRVIAYVSFPLSMIAILDLGAMT
jgi:hypothetical protein